MRGTKIVSLHSNGSCMHHCVVTYKRRCVILMFSSVGMSSVDGYLGRMSANQHAPCNYE